MNILVVDIGGTNVRLAVYADGKLGPLDWLAVADYAQFDLEVRSGRFVLPDTLAEAWRNSLDSTGKPLPHGLGWFVQTYNGDKVVWQFGSGGDNGGSSSITRMVGSCCAISVAYLV